MSDNPQDAGLSKLYVIPIPFKLISKSNHKGRGNFLPAKYRVFEESIARLAVASCKRPLLEHGWVVIRPHFKTRVHCDLNNLTKSIFDGLIKGGVFFDDKIIASTVVLGVYGDMLSEVEIWG